ncbi:hypothetical protein EST38_g2658 [Candolleomyces aberdarensis]|uniref:Uncharacterized protein n=1 Tax=Candolleomyces aberdarensis TaxID=2316362 RepID=A0A4Q2DW63_9AGAR|nr:hypothetical protein EST38_g2658 [Candolleomyces aberdarensis]
MNQKHLTVSSHYHTCHHQPQVEHLHHRRLKSSSNGQSTAPRPCPKPTKFTNEQKTYLNSHLDVFLAECAHLDKTGAGPRKVKGNKGTKKAWVERKVILGFVKTFQLAGSDGPKLITLSSRIYQWYVNKHKDLMNATEAKPAKKDQKLKAKSASALFAKDHADEIRVKAREKGHTSSGEYLKNYHSVKKEMYDQSDQKISSHTRLMPMLRRRP